MITSFEFPKYILMLFAILLSSQNSKYVSSLNADGV